jgi:hypothetical protein
MVILLHEQPSLVHNCFSLAIWVTTAKFGHEWENCLENVQKPLPTDPLSLCLIHDVQFLGAIIQKILPPKTLFFPTATLVLW